MALRADRMSTARRMAWRCVFACAMSLTLSSPAHAEEDPARNPSRGNAAGLLLPPRANAHDGNDTPRSKTASSGSGLWTTALALGAIVGGLALAGRWLKPYLGAPRGLPIEALELLGRRMIEPKVAIHLVRCGNKVLVLGVSPDGVRPLSEIADPGEVARLTEACLSKDESRRMPPAPKVPAARDRRNSPITSVEELHHA